MNASKHVELAILTIQAQTCVLNVKMAAHLAARAPQIAQVVMLEATHHSFSSMTARALVHKTSELNKAICVSSAQLHVRLVSMRQQLAQAALTI